MIGRGQRPGPFLVCVRSDVFAQLLPLSLTVLTDLTPSTKKATTQTGHRLKSRSPHRGLSDKSRQRQAQAAITNGFGPLVSAEMWPWGRGVTSRNLSTHTWGPPLWPLHFIRMSLLRKITVCSCARLHTCNDNVFKVGPDYFKPAASVSADWIDSYDERISTDLFNDTSWWDVFGAPVLLGLMQNAFSHNLTLRAAGMRVQRAIRAIAADKVLTQQQQVFGRCSGSMLSRKVFPGNLPGAARASGRWSGGCDAFWEIDVWSRFRRNIESFDASQDASIESYDDILVILVADVAAIYVEIHMLQQQYVKNNIALLKVLVEIADAHNKGGQFPELDPLQAHQNVPVTEQTIPQLEAQLRNANPQLCTFPGILPRDLIQESGEADISVVSVEIAIGVLADLLRRRPDVRHAERLVAAQFGIAVADLYPHFSVSGNIRVEATPFSNRWNSASGAGPIGPVFNRDVLNYACLQNNVLLQDAQFPDLAVNHRPAVVQASQENESTLVNFLKARERLQGLNDLVATVEKPVKTGVAQYQAGVTDSNRVSILQLALVRVQNSVAIATGEVTQSLIAIYRAIGGGWEIRLAPTGPVAQIQLPHLPVDEVPSIQAEAARQKLKRTSRIEFLCRLPPGNFKQLSTRSRSRRMSL